MKNVLKTLAVVIAGIALGFAFSGCSSIQKEVSKLPPNNLVGVKDDFTCPFFGKHFSLGAASKGADGSANVSQASLQFTIPLWGVVWSASAESYSQPAGAANPTAQPVTSAGVVVAPAAK